MVTLMQCTMNLYMFYFIGSGNSKENFVCSSGEESTKLIAQQQIALSSWWHVKVGVVNSISNHSPQDCESKTGGKQRWTTKWKKGELLSVNFRDFNVDILKSSFPMNLCTNLGFIW